MGSLVQTGSITLDELTIHPLPHHSRHCCASGSAVSKAKDFGPFTANYFSSLISIANISLLGNSKEPGEKRQ